MNWFQRYFFNAIRMGFLFVFLLLYLGCGQRDSFVDNTIGIKHKRFNSVRFDPSYYYETELGVDELCHRLTQQWREAGVNAVYIKVYDPIYGAVYRTEHPLNVQTDYGRLDFLRVMLDACHDVNIRVYAWIPAFQHKHAWQVHPEWRVKNSDGTDYQPSPDTYFLCVRNPEFVKWWIGFIDELLKRYEDVDGVDIAEPIVAWSRNGGCFCDLCAKAFQNVKIESGMRNQKQFDIVRSEPLTALLESSCRLIHNHGKSVSITTVATPNDDGSLFSIEEQSSLTGFDLQMILNSQEKPDIINVELIWQQWTQSFGDTVVFTPRWTENAVKEVISQVNNRADLVIHVELTPFEGIVPDNEQFLESIVAAFDAGASGIDFYDTFQADQRGLWPQIKNVFNYVPLKRVVVYYDPEGENDARQLEVLLRHFNTETVLFPVEENFSIPDSLEADIIFYLGVTYRKNLPTAFISYLSQMKKTVCWLNYNLRHLGEDYLSWLGFHVEELDEDSLYRVFYKGAGLAKLDSSMNIIRIQEVDKCRVLAYARSEDREVPYVVNSGDFWYFADLPTNFVTEGGRHIVFADLLHDILMEDHEEKHLALVRIEDVNPESDPKSLRSIANFLGSKKIPFSVGVTPFYLDPATNTALSLSDRPEIVKALHHMVSKGGTIVLHGYTHQYRGQTTIDYEFWDGLTDQPIFQDSEEYVQERILKALDECFNVKLYPLVWETPHYAASLLDYRVIDRFFTTAYERRQTMDILGTDQLLPFLIPARRGGAQMIPENLGYIPMSDTNPERFIEYARRNLVLRDGFASFFFHPFVPIDVLKELVKGIQELGYSFADIRTLNNRVVTPSKVVLSNRGEISLDLKEQYLDEFYLTQNGKMKERSTGDKRISSNIHRELVCPNGWIYVARALDERKRGFPASLWASISKSPIRADELWRLPPLKSANTPVSPMIFIDPDAEGKLSISQQSFLSSFESVGIDYRTISVYDFIEIPQGVNLVVLPYTAATKLTEQQMLFIISALARGMNIILEKETELSRRIGIQPIGEEKQVSMVRDEYYPQVGIHWKEKDFYRNCEVDVEYVTYYSEKNTDDPVVIGGEYGEGKYLYFATLFDPTTSKGYGRYPYYCDLIQRQFDLWPILRKDCVEIYFEPGDREDVSIEDLVKMWKESGFRTIYVAGWHVYSEWIYDYGRLIQLAHQNGMLVYLWLEIPHVGQKFWDDHPEWREKTASGNDAIVDWRRLMALTDDSCLEAVFHGLSNIIQNYDWDGVNLAELYFESPLGPERPDIFTPMHPSVRVSFESQYGFDPIKLFDESSPYFWRRDAKKFGQFLRFREDLVVKLHEEFLQFLHEQIEQKDSDIEIIVTIIDNIHAKITGKYTATDTKRLISLGNKLPFTLQIEDPQELWHLGPYRYENLSQTYNRLLSNGNLILDINIVPYRSFEKSLAPTRYPTGLELYSLIQSARQDTNRVALYSESSVYAVDLPWIAYTLGSHTTEEFFSHEWRIHSKNTVNFDLDTKEHNDILVDGRLWPAYYKGNAILPSGTHTIRPLSKVESLKNNFKVTTRLVDISGELKSCRMLSRGIEIVYDSAVRNYIIINDKPREIFLDGKKFQAETFHGIPGYSLKLPAGSHKVKIITWSQGSLQLRNFSIIASVLIVSISSVAGFMLLVLYMRGYRRRRKSRKK